MLLNFFSKKKPPNSHPPIENKDSLIQSNSQDNKCNIARVPIAVLVYSIFPDLSLVDILAFGASCKYFNELVNTNLLILFKERAIPTKTEEVKTLKSLVFKHSTKMEPLCDTFVFGEYPEVMNKPAYSNQEIKAYMINNRTVLMKFDLSSYSSIKKAHLRLWKTWDGRQHGHYGRDSYIFHIVDNDWDENATWNTQPKPILPYQQLQTISGAINCWHEIVVTDLFNNALKAFKSPRAPKIISFSFRGNDNGSLSCFVAKESPIADKRPHLNVVGTL